MKKLLILLLFTSYIQAQHTLQLKEGQSSPKANLSEVSWITGHWKGEAFGGIAEEIWSPPLGNSMMFVFKHIKDGEVTFYEIGHIQEHDNSLRLQLKHFGKNLKGWEEKDETEDFNLVKIEEDIVYFNELTFEKIKGDEINVYVVVHHKDGSKSEEKFNYIRQ